MSDINNFIVFSTLIVVILICIRMIYSANCPQCLVMYKRTSGYHGYCCKECYQAAEIEYKQGTNRANGFYRSR